MNARERLRLAATGGRSDTLRVVCTAIGAGAAAFLLLVVVTVLSIRGDYAMGSYRVRLLNESGLRGGVVTALLLLVLPVLVFTGVSSRLGSPARDRRLAAIRLAGATPSDVRWVVALETGLTATAGSLLGAGAFLLARVLLDGPAWPSAPPEAGGPPPGAYPRAWPTDVALHPGAVVLALAVVPVAATLLSVLALRRVALTPFGVVKAEGTRVPAALPVVALAVGCSGVVLSSTLAQPLRSLGYLAWSLTVWASVALALVGLLWGSASVALATGRLLAGRARGVAGLVAGRRLVARPYEASKVTASIILAVVAGGAAAVLRSATLDSVAAQNGQNGVTDGDQLSFFSQSYDLVYGVVAAGLVLSCAGLLVLQVEALVSRRRTLAGLVAAGTPRGVLVRATLLEVLAPLVPMVVAAAGVSAAVATWWFAGMTDDGVSTSTPWGALAVLVLGAVALVVLTTLLSLVTLRAATRPEELRLAT